MNDRVRWWAGLLVPAVLAVLAVVGQEALAATKKKPKKPAAAAVKGELEGKAALEPFFRSLVQEGAITRVLHFGDSHVAADYWTGELRRRLQGRFGDAGPGQVLPGKPWKSYRHAQARSISGGGWETVGVGREEGDGLYGLSGAALSPTGEEGAAALEASFSDFRVQLMTLSRGACVSVTVDGTTYFSGLLTPGEEGAEAGDSCCHLRVEPVEGTPFEVVTVGNTAPLDASLPHRLEIRDACGGPSRILGVDLTSGRGGVIVDTLGINGAEIGSLGKWNADLRRLLLVAAAPALVVVSYGTNEMGRGDFDFTEYRGRVVELLRGLRQDLPGTAFLVTGPVDRGARRKKAAAVISRNRPLVIRALREAAGLAGCAFWDARAAMGGDGSIRRWGATRLAQRDQVHLTAPGYVKLAGLLHERLMAALEAWKRQT